MHADVNIVHRTYLLFDTDIVVLSYTPHLLTNKADAHI